MTNERLETIREKIKEQFRDKIFDQIGMQVGDQSLTVREVILATLIPFVEAQLKEVGEEAFDTSKVTRVEVIDHLGRSYGNWDDNNKVELRFQDNNRTLKVFISRLNQSNESDKA